MLQGEGRVLPEKRWVGFGFSFEEHVQLSGADSTGLKRELEKQRIDGLIKIETCYSITCKCFQLLLLLKSP